jgi:hypothetical protein
MSKRSLCLFAALCGLMMFVLCATPSGAQAAANEKPPMYTYVANWQIPRAHWADMAKANAADSAILDKALADGTIVGYGNDENLVHQSGGETHDNWWSAMSMAGLVKVLDQFYASPNTTSDVLESATKHWDAILVSRYYNWHPGSYKGGYTHVGEYKLKADAPDDALDTLCKNMVVPLLEKMLADGTILEYEVDTMAIHTEAPGTFWITYIAPKPEGLDKVHAAIVDSRKAQPLSGSAFGSMTDDSGHRDELVRGDGTFK